MCNAMREKQRSYQCIECGKPAEELYREFSRGVIKLAHCEHCKNVIDKYIEYDAMIIFLDALLLKRPAYRHILINSQILHKWKLGLVLLLCEAFIKLMSLKASSGDSSTQVQLDAVFYSALELNLYWSFFLAMLDLLTYVSLLLVFIHLFKWFVTGEKLQCMRDVVSAIIMSGFGRSLVILSIFWGLGYSTLFLTLNDAFVLACNLQAVRVVCPEVPVGALVGMMAVSFVGQQLLMSLLPTHVP